MQLIIDDSVITLSQILFKDSILNVEHYFPIDRFFIEEKEYLEKILSVDYLQFIFYNFEIVNPTYSVQLFLCLPELWKKITYSDIYKLIENFTNSFSFYSFIQYTYKYLEVDLFDEIICNLDVDDIFKKDCIKYSLNTIETLCMDKDDYEEFEQNIFGISIEQLIDLKQYFTTNMHFRKSLGKKELHYKLNKLKLLNDNKI